jgi:hypothetical protein
MSFVIQYFRHDHMVCETSWIPEIPPSSRFIRSNFAAHDADRAVILGGNGFELIVEERQEFDA